MTALVLDARRAGGRVDPERHRRHGDDGYRPQEDLPWIDEVIQKRSGSRLLGVGVTLTPGQKDAL